jgi:hypothetical protein
MSFSPFRWPGSAPDARAYFLLLRQKKVAKEKATPGSAPGCARSLALLGRPGTPGVLFRVASQRSGRVSLNSPAAQTTRDDTPRPACVAQRHAGGPGTPSQFRRPPSWPKATSFRRKPESRRPMDSGLRRNDMEAYQPSFGFPGPLRGAEQRRGWRIKGEHCLRAQPELRSPRHLRVAQGTRVAGTDPGVAFSLATFFWPPKRKYARASGAEPSA